MTSDLLLTTKLDIIHKLSSLTLTLTFLNLKISLAETKLIVLLEGWLPSISQLLFMTLPFLNVGKLFLWCWRRLLRVPWTARSNWSVLKEINPEYSLEGLTLKLKLQYSGHLMQTKNWLLRKDPDAGKDWRQEDKGTTEDETVEWHHWLNGHGFE